jgi:hypothetical protein
VGRGGMGYCPYREVQTCSRNIFLASLRELLIIQIIIGINKTIVSISYKDKTVGKCARA